jgi:hypothetical protein
MPWCHCHLSVRPTPRPPVAGLSILTPSPFLASLTSAGGMRRKKKLESVGVVRRRIKEVSRASIVFFS